LKYRSFSHFAKVNRTSGEAVPHTQTLLHGNLMFVDRIQQQKFSGKTKSLNGYGVNYPVKRFFIKLMQTIKKKTPAVIIHAKLMSSSTSMFNPRIGST